MAPVGAVGRARSWSPPLRASPAVRPATLGCGRPAAGGSVWSSGSTCGSARTTKVCSGDQVRRTSSPGAHSSARGGPLDVLLVDGQPGAAAGLDDVRGADPEVRRVADRPEQGVVPGRRRPRRRRAGGSSRAGRRPRPCVPSAAPLRGTRTLVSSARRTSAYAVGAPSSVPGSRLLTPRKPATKRVVGPLVEALRVAQLLVPAAVHDGDPIGHRHRLFLVVGHVDERDPDLLLDALELDLHLLAQLEVERAERLVEEEDRRPVDERPGEGDPLGLAAGDLGRLALLEAGQLDELEHLGDAGLDLARP